MSTKITNEYPSIEGVSEDDMTPRQKRVSQVAFVISSTGITASETIVSLRRKNGTLVQKRIKLSDREKFLINEMFLDFLERRRPAKRLPQEMVGLYTLSEFRQKAWDQILKPIE